MRQLLFLLLLFTAPLSAQIIYPDPRVVGEPIPPVDSLGPIVARQLNYHGKPDSCVVAFDAHLVGPLTNAIVESGNVQLGDAALDVMYALGYMNIWAYPANGPRDTAGVHVRMKLYYGIAAPRKTNANVIAYENLPAAKKLLPATEEPLARYWGQVTDASTKLPLAAVAVSAYDQEGKFLGTALTDYNGNYSLSLNVREPSAKVRLEFVTEGYRKTIVNGVPFSEVEISPAVTTVAAAKQKCESLACVREVYLAAPKY